MNRSTLGVVVGSVLAALAGYWIASRGDSTRQDGQSSMRSRDHESRSDGDPNSGHQEKKRTTAQLTALKNDLRRRFLSCPSPDHDWALREQAASILGSLSQEELKEFARELLPTGTGFDALPEWQHSLLREVFRQWGLKDPAAACLGLADLPWTFTSRAGAFQDWLRRDPEAAKAWITSGHFPPGSEKALVALQESYLNHEAATDFTAALDSLGKLDAKLGERMLLTWSRQLALDVEKRDGLLELIASHDNPDFARNCYRRLVTTMADKSLHDADAFVENSSLPDDEKDELHELILGRWATTDPQEAFARWAELKNDSAPAPLLNAINSWSLNSPGTEQAIDWVTKLDPGPAREQFKNRLIESMSDGERYDQAAELSATLDDPVERLRQMKSVKLQWEEKFPQHAKQWYDKLPQEDRHSLGTALK